MNSQRTARNAGLALAILMTLLLGSWSAAHAQTSSVPEPVPPAAAQGAGGHLDPAAATEAYLATLSPADRARSDAYFEGGYWLQLWGLLYGLGVCWLWLKSGLAVRLRNWAERLFPTRPWLQTAAFAPPFLVLGALFSFPLDVYQGYFREHQYGLSNQTFAAWLGDNLKGLGVSLILGTLAIVGIYRVFRAAPRSWWIWGTVVSVVFLMFVALIAPVFIAPLFNKYTRLENPKIAGPILSMARANEVPVKDVWVMDASRQSKRISANVSGFGNTMRITLNDNLLARCSVGEIKAVMGHELGHYVMNHIYKAVLAFALVIAFGFAFLAWSFERVRSRWAANRGVRSLADPAGLPLLGAIFSVFFFFMTPVTNTIIRVNEAEADAFGLNAAREPDGFASTALKLSEYRKLSPTPLEEILFYDHPSGRNRILRAMTWKAEHLDELAARDSANSAP
ncbi:MAG: M48 family metallopeptidase [Thermoanaerobaculia bacterium]